LKGRLSVFWWVGEYQQNILASENFWVRHSTVCMRNFVLHFQDFLSNHNNVNYLKNCWEIKKNDPPKVLTRTRVGHYLNKKLFFIDLFLFLFIILICIIIRYSLLRDFYLLYFIHYLVIRYSLFVIPYNHINNTFKSKITMYSDNILII
jgi:hypothetical protein